MMNDLSKLEVMSLITALGVDLTQAHRDGDVTLTDAETKLILAATDWVDDQPEAHSASNRDYTNAQLSTLRKLMAQYHIAVEVVQ